jgi:hypothetical protein
MIFDKDTSYSFYLNIWKERQDKNALNAKLFRQKRYTIMDIYLKSSPIKNNAFLQNISAEQWEEYH